MKVQKQSSLLYLPCNFKYLILSIFLFFTNPAGPMNIFEVKCRLARSSVPIPLARGEFGIERSVSQFIILISFIYKIGP